MNTPFRTILVLLTLMVIGVAVIPLLSLQYMPQKDQRGITIECSWPGASAKVIESEVTSVIEGAIAQISGISNITSRSSKDNSSVSVTLKDGVKSEAVRFEISSRLRSIYPKLPQGVSYPWISAGISGNEPTTILIYTVNCDLPTWEISRYAQSVLVENISTIEGVESVVLYGATPYEWVVTYDTKLCNELGITVGDISAALPFGASQPVGMVQSTDYEGTIAVNFTKLPLEPYQWAKIEVKNVDGHIIYLGDIAVVSRQEQPIRWYSRVNGLNIINLSISAEAGSNTLVLAAKVKERIKELETQQPEGFSLLLVNDQTTYINKELNKILYRTVLSE